jgi:Ca-activated chloride channel family protein
MRFENPDLLQLLWVLALQAVMLLAYWRWRTRTLRQLGSPQLEERLLVGFSKSRFWIKNGLFAMVAALIALAIANPQKMGRETPPPKASADVLIALDVSRSMLANDVAPSRLTQAKIFVETLVKSLRSERVGFIVFAGDAFPQAPLTNDPDVLLLFIKNAAPDAVNDQGTNFTSAIELAQRMLPAESEAGRALILISDGENHTPEALEAAQKAKEEGLTIHMVGVGTAGGSSIPVSSGNLLRDYSGQVVRTQLDATVLRDVAKAGGGIYTQLGEGNPLNDIKTAITQLRRTTVEQQAVTTYHSYFQWLILPALLLLVIEQLIWWRKEQ